VNDCGIGQHTLMTEASGGVKFGTGPSVDQCTPQVEGDSRIPAVVHTSKGIVCELAVSATSMPAPEMQNLASRRAAIRSRSRGESPSAVENALTA
jgi:hypothetical protein